MENTCVCCGREIPEGSQVCYMCMNGMRKRTYIEFNCPECGAPLEVLAEYLVAKSVARFDCFGYEKRELIRHCNNCHCDWVNEWENQFGDVGESQPRRKFWG
jgi:predicted RNA-binding Zn-ribbon protein involved in translation (DUF1610 family)